MSLRCLYTCIWLHCYVLSTIHNQPLAEFVYIIYIFHFLSVSAVWFFTFEHSHVRSDAYSICMWCVGDKHFSSFAVRHIDTHYIYVVDTPLYALSIDCCCCCWCVRSGNEIFHECSFYSPPPSRLGACNIGSEWQFLLPSPSVPRYQPKQEEYMIHAACIQPITYRRSFSDAYTTRQWVCLSIVLFASSVWLFFPCFPFTYTHTHTGFPTCIWIDLI